MISTEPLFVVDNVAVFADHADKQRFWYLPGTVAIARRASDGKAIFSFIKYRDAETTDGKVTGGGYLSFEVSLGLSDRTRAAIEGRLAGLAATHSLAPVAFEEGTVICTVLGTTTGASASASAGGGVRLIGTAKPSLMGDNNAIFTCELDAGRATLLMEALASDAQLLGVMYELTYVAMQPPIRARVKADWSKVLMQLDAKFGAEAQWKLSLDAEVGAFVRDLTEKGALVIETVNTDPSAEQQAHLDAMIAWVKDTLLKDFFKAELTLPASRVRDQKLKSSPVDAVTKDDPPPEDPPEKDPPEEDPPEKDPPEEDPPEKDPPEEDPPEKDPPEKDPPEKDPPDEEAERKAKETAQEKAKGGSSPIDLPGVTPPKLPVKLPTVKFRLQADYSREARSFAFEYAAQKAVKRTFRPQGLFGLAGKREDLERAGYFKEISLHDEFFQVFKVSVYGPATWKAIGLGRADVVVTYEGALDERTKRRQSVRKELAFTAPGTAESGLRGEATFTAPMYRGVVDDFRYQITYGFDPTAGWDGDRGPFTIERASSIRTVYADPEPHFTFRKVRVELTRTPDWERVRQVRVDLRYPSELAEGAPPASYRRQLVFSSAGVASDGDAPIAASVAVWKLRLQQAGADDAVSYRVSYLLADGKVEAPPAQETRDADLAITTPYPSQDVDIEIRPFGAWTGIELADVVVQYPAGAEALDAQRTFTFVADGKRPAAQTWKVRVRDPGATRFRWKATCYTDTGDVREIAWKEQSLATEPTIRLSPPRGA